MAEETRGGATSTERADLPVDVLPLSNRTRARLHEAGIRTVAQLSGRTDDDLLALPGFGHTCLREVQSVLRVLSGSPGAATVLPGDAAFPVEVPDALRHAPLLHLPLSNRARGVFQREGLATVAEYLALGPERLLMLRNFGETTFQAVNRAIHAAVRAAAGAAATEAAPFGAAGVLTGEPELCAGLRTVPLSALDLPRRARRACQELGLRTLGDLAGISTSDLLVRRNFGQATLRRIQSEMDRFMRDQSAPGSPSFAATLDHVLGRLRPKERRLVELREGSGGHPPRTLTEAGRAMEITESRACQIEHAAWAKLRRFSAGVTDLAAERAVALLMRHGGVATPESLAEDPYFRDGGLDAGYVGRMLGRLLTHRLARLADGRLAAVPAATLATLAARLRKRLNRSSESILLATLTADVLRGLDLGADRSAVVPALCEVLFHREVAHGHDGEPVVRTAAQGMGDDLRRILQQAGRPLHFGEIARQVMLPPYLRTDLSEEKVRLRLCRDRRFVLVRRGLYDLRERFRVDPIVRGALARLALDVLHEAGRPTSVALVAGRLRTEPRFARISEFVVAAVLRDDPRFTHLGRGTFVPADAGETSVLHVSAILEQVLREAGQALSYAELRRRVQERRQVSDGAISATLVGRATFLRVARGMFDLAERHPYDGAERARIAQAAAAALLERSGVASLGWLQERIPWPADPAPGPVLLGDLLRRAGGFRFLGGGHVCVHDGALERSLAARAVEMLEAAGEPLRPSTIGRRLRLGDGALALLRRVLREDARFAAEPDGRFGLAPG